MTTAVRAELTEDPQGPCVHVDAGACADCAADALRAARSAQRARQRDAAEPVRAHTPTQRITALLAVLRKGRGRVVPYDMIRLAVPGYGDSKPEARAMNRDLTLLASRGLVELRVADPGLGADSYGVRLVENVKPFEFELTADEHDALVRARAATGGGPLPSVLPDGPDGSVGRDVDTLLRMVRAIEEHQDEIGLDRLADLVGVTRREAVKVLREAHDMRDPDRYDGSLFAGLTIHYTDDDVDDVPEADLNTGDAYASVSIVRSPVRRGRPSPTAYLGLDELGRFAYTATECHDRLDVIAEAIDSGWAKRDGQRTVDALASARSKIGGWLARLTG